MQSDQCASHPAQLRATPTHELRGVLASSIESAL